MKEILSFPGLGFEIALNPEVFSIGPLSIKWYGLLIAVGLLLGAIYANKRSKEFGINQDKFIDVLVIGTIGSIIFARAYYVIFSWDMFKDDILSAFKIWEGGIAIYGSIIGALLVGGLAARAKKMKVMPLIDLTLNSFLIGQAVGRWGNFVNIEAFGSNTTMPWGMTSDSIDRKSVV